MTMEQIIYHSRGDNDNSENRMIPISITLTLIKVLKIKVINYDDYKENQNDDTDNYEIVT